MSERRPNILFAIADDASHMSAYGHRFVSTPNFDRVAADGVLFTAAFTTNPKCAPSRASILTGKHTWQLEDACCHFGIFPAKFRVYPDLLEAAGYHVGYTGKGWSPGDWRRGGFSRNPAGNEYNARTLTTPDGTRISTRDYAACFGDFLAARPDGAPFCFWYGGHEPHRPYSVGEGLRAGKSTDAVDLPTYWPDDEIVRGDVLDYANEVEWFDRQLGVIIERLDAAGELQNTLIVVTSDNGMPFPRVKGQMYDQDFRLPMAACWPGVVKAGRTVDDLISFTDLAPTFLEIAGVPVDPQIAGRSLVPVLRDRRSGRIDPERDHVVMGRERHDMGREGDVGYPVRCIRTEELLYVRNFKPELWPAGNPETGFTNCDGSPTKDLILALEERGDERYFDLCFGRRPAEELYDIRHDPECVINLAGEPEYRKARERLWADLEKILRETGDPRIFGGGDVFDGYEYVGEARHSWKARVQGTWQKQPY